jgi:hypothetical protein
VSIPLGAVIYFSLCKLMGIAGADRLIEVAAKRLRR